MTTKSTSSFNPEPTIPVNFRGRKVRVIYFEHEDYGYRWNFIGKNSGAMIDSMTKAEYRAIYSQIRRNAQERERRRTR
jgi:hypothetical protein